MIMTANTYDGFALGDVATLKSGGPKMTVEGFDAIPLAPTDPAGSIPQVLVKCMWFNEAGAFSFHSFPSWTLTGGSGDEPVATTPTTTKPVSEPVAA